MIFKNMEELAFKTYGTHMGCMQIEYLTKDLCMDPLHQLKSYFMPLTSHSEAQLYYPLVCLDPEVGAPFLGDHNIQIVWNAVRELFMALNLSCCEDLKGSWELYKDKFLLAEQYKNDKDAKSASTTAKKTGGSNKSKDGGNATQPISCAGLILVDSEVSAITTASLVTKHKF